jgi:hypothetical protein
MPLSVHVCIMERMAFPAVTLPGYVRSNRTMFTSDGTRHMLPCGEGTDRKVLCHGFRVNSMITVW